MLPVNQQYLNLIRGRHRAPYTMALFQIPVQYTLGATTVTDYNKLGAQLIVDKITTLRRTSILEPGSDICDISFSNQDGSFSPISASSPLGKFMFPGAADNKMQIFIGVTNDGTTTLYPKGTFVSETFAQQSIGGKNIATVNALDQASLFRGQVYTQFPPRLYGIQNSSYFNPNYALTNPSGDLKTYICDARNWMQNVGQSPLWASDYQAVAVYVSTTAAGATAVDPSTYTIDYINGKITFTALQASTAVVSVDARPLAMAPEMMLKHLFVDFGNFDPNFLKFDRSGIDLPIMEVARDRSIFQIAIDIAYATAPRGIRWQIFFNEDGYLTFSELAIDGPEVRTLTDENDILSFTPEYTSRNIVNVVRAQATSSSNQPILSVSYDLNSIATFSQKPTYDIPSQYLATVSGMDSGSAAALMNRLTGSVLFELSTPTIQSEVVIIPDPSLQVGDVIKISEKKTGMNTSTKSAVTTYTQAYYGTLLALSSSVASVVTSPVNAAGDGSKKFYIKQIDEEISGDAYKQTLRLEQYRDSQDFMAGLQQYAGAPNATNSNSIQALSGIISDVQINGTHVVLQGNPQVDSNFNPVVPTWDGVSTLPISITAAPIATSDSWYIWRWIYIADDAYAIQANPVVATGRAFVTHSYTSTLQAIGDIMCTLMGDGGYQSCAPYDVRTNADTASSRRYYWPVLRDPSWVTNDGVTGYTTSTTLTTNYSGGIGGSAPYLYGRMRVGVSDYDAQVTSGFNGVALYAPGTLAANAIGASSTSKIGVDFGVPSSQALFTGIHRKVTPAYLGIMCASTAGVVQVKRIPFNIVV